MKSTTKLVFLVPSLFLAASTVAPLSRAQAATYSRLQTSWRARCTPGAAGRVAIPLAAGAHTVSLQNTGADWATIQSIALTDYAPVLGAYGLGSDSFAVAWVYHRSGVKALGIEPTAATGILALSGLKAGRYRATWWDTRRGAALSVLPCVVARGKPLLLPTPAVSRDVAVFVVRG